MSNTKTNPEFFERHQELCRKRPVLHWGCCNVRGDVCDIVVYYRTSSGLKKALQYETEYAPEYEDEMLSELYSHMFDVCGIEPDMYTFKYYGRADLSSAV